MVHKLSLPTKRMQISKANSSMVLAVAICSFVITFSLVGSRALWSQRSYQARVIAKKEQARDQLKKNVATTATLSVAYQSFVNQPQNVIGGNPNGTGDKDGNNAKIILDALPSQYDFPALTSSLEKVITANSLTINAISGTDDEAAQQDVAASGNPQPVEMPFDITVTGNYTNIQSLISVFEHSIRPFSIDSITLSGSDTTLQAEIKAKTYYQPAETYTIGTTEVQ